jgi:FkbM family methyltransferase
MTSQIELNPKAPPAERLKAMAGNFLMGTIGRRNLVRVARYLTNTARLDVLNDMRVNGEALVQDTVLTNFAADRELVVFDVGANLGEWTLQLLARSDLAKCSAGTLHAFEPVSSTMRTLQQNLRAINTGWKILSVQQALSDKPGRAEIAVVEEGCGINSLTPDARQPIKRKETVELATIDEYCEAHYIAEIGLLIRASWRQTDAVSEGHPGTPIRVQFSLGLLTNDAAGSL